MMSEYSITNALKRIETLLIKSMLENFEMHKVREVNEGREWTMWQRLQLKALERYRKRNAIVYDDKFNELNQQIEALFKDSYDDASDGAIGINDDKLDALVTATVDDITKAEHAVLRKANDEYRKIIFDAVTYANTGGTYEQAIDMATQDFLRRGITSIQYKNGARHTISDYASMAIRTGSKRAYLMGLGNKMNEMGVHIVRVNKRTDACPFCVQWIGRVLVDDVYSGGTRQEAEEKGYPLLSEAMDEGFLHPNCKDTYSIYIEGVSKPEERLTKEEAQRMVDIYNQEQSEKRAKDKADSYGRLADFSLGDKQKEHYKALEDKWEQVAKEIEEPYTVKDLETTLKEVEDGIRDQSHEWFVSMDENGNIQTAITSFEKHFVDVGSIIPRSDYERVLKDRIATHNHPSGGTFSHQDIELAFKASLREMRACSINGVCRLRRTFDIGDNIPQHYFDFYDDYEAVTQSIRNRAINTAWNNLNANRPDGQLVDLDTFNDEIFNISDIELRDWLKTNATHYGWEYIEE